MIHHSPADKPVTPLTWNKLRKVTLLTSCRGQNRKAVTFTPHTLTCNPLANNECSVSSMRQIQTHREEHHGGQGQQSLPPQPSLHPSLLHPKNDALTERWFHSREAQSSRCASRSSWSHWGAHLLPPPRRSWFLAGGCAPWALLTPLEETKKKQMSQRTPICPLAPFGYFLKIFLFCPLKYFWRIT